MSGAPSVASPAPQLPMHGARARASPQARGGGPTQVMPQTDAGGQVLAVMGGNFITVQPVEGNSVAFVSLPIAEQTKLRAKLLESAQEFKRDVLQREKKTAEGNKPKAQRHRSYTCELCPELASYLCSYCNNGWYCSRRCQIAHWPTHSTMCTRKDQPYSRANGSAAFGLSPPTTSAASGSSVLTHSSAAVNEAYFPHHQQGRHSTSAAASYQQPTKTNVATRDATYGRADYVVRSTASTTAEAAASQQAMSVPLCSMCPNKATCKCSVCGQQYYCSRQCQVQAWSTHERHCRPPPTPQPPGNIVSNPNKRAAVDAAGGSAAKQRVGEGHHAEQAS
eukprot:m.133169 g.133169  ORF g.133169 m.133169 type:complete len:336 (+) comp13826_c0_seq2:45-1052(+)